MMEQNKAGAGAPAGVNDFKRQARALGALIDDPESLGQALDILATFEREIAAGALRLKAEGYSFADLGRANGTARQTSAERWGKTWRRLGLTTKETP